MRETEYRKHFISRLDVRVRLLVVFAILAMVISCRGFFLPLMILGLSLALCLSLKVSARALMIRLAEPILIALVIVILKLFFSGQKPLFTFAMAGFTVTGYGDGLTAGLLIASRIMAATALVAVVSFSTAFTELLSGFSWLRAPRELIEILIFTYRYIFVLLEDAQIIYNSQKSRLGYSSWKRGLKSFGALAGALVIKAFEQSQAVTQAMVQRGYDGNIPLLQHKPLRPKEVIVGLVVVLLTGVAWQL